MSSLSRVITIASKFSWNQVALLRRFIFGNDWEEAMPDANYFANWHGGAALSRRVQTYRR